MPNRIYAFGLRSSNGETTNVHDNVHNVHDQYAPDDTLRIINAIRRDPNISLGKLADLIGKSIKTVRRIIKNSGRIIRVGSRNGGHWEVVDEVFR